MTEEARSRLARIEESVHQFLACVEQAPEDRLQRAPGPEGWSANEALAHVAEFVPYWAHQAKLVAESKDNLPSFGRTHEDPDRIAAVAEHARDARDEGLRRVRAGAAEALSVLRALPPEAWGRQGQHVRRGPMTVSGIIDSFLLDHVEEHRQQAEAALSR